MQTIKSLARGPWGETAKTRATWYQPLEEQSEIDAAVGWAMERSGIFLNTAGDIHILPRMLEAIARCEADATSARSEVSQLELTPLFV